MYSVSSALLPLKPDSSARSNWHTCGFFIASSWKMQLSVSMVGTPPTSIDRLTDPIDRSCIHGVTRKVRLKRDWSVEQQTEHPRVDRSVPSLVTNLSPAAR